MKVKHIPIPTDQYEEHIDKELPEEKQKEILASLTNFNQLCSEEEYEEIKYDLRTLVREGDLELIKIYLSETIRNDSQGLIFKIDKTNKTASLFKIKDNINEIIVPRTVKKESTEYLITSVCGTNEYIKKIQFSEDSAVKTIYRHSFPYYSSINEIHFPSSLKELKEGWRFKAQFLNKIIISPSNDQFKFIDDKYLVGKSDKNIDEFDTLLFVSRHIKEISIPSNIKIISSYALYNCYNIEKVVFSQNSNLHTIGKSAFGHSKLSEISIPASVLKICQKAFSSCRFLKKIEIPENSNLQIIESKAFGNSKIEEIFIPSKIKKIVSDSLADCRNLLKVDISENSNLQTIESRAFWLSNIKEINFPSSLIELKEGWVDLVCNLTKITISPSNSHFIFKDDKYLLGKSDQSSDEFDILLFASRDINEITIPSNIKIISSYAFDHCRNLTKVAFSPNSNLQTIDKNAFSYSNINEISIPASVSKINDGAFLNCKYLTKVDIPTNSNLQIIESDAFAYSKIEKIFIPSGLRELKEGFCYCASNLTKIEISPSNGQFLFKDDKYLLAKSDQNSQFDTFLFARCDIKEISIPSNIKIISSLAFFDCFNLEKVEIPTNSILQDIGEYTFFSSKIKEIFIPTNVSKIRSRTFSDCKFLKKVEITTNSNLQIIESYAFKDSDIVGIFIPSNVSKISRYAFYSCKKLQIVEIAENSKLKLYQLSVFSDHPNLIIMIPSSF